MTVLEVMGHRLSEHLDDGCRFGEGARADVAFIGEIETGFDQRQRIDQACAPSIIEIGQRARRLRQSLAPLPLRLGIDEIRETLDFGEVELARLERAPRELARAPPCAGPEGC